MESAGAGHPAALLDGRYALGECIGEGGMARVYRAEDAFLGRTVAIKLIRPGIDGASSERAHSEMRVLASLNHPSLVTLFDAHLVPGQPEYLVMELVEGPSLADRLASGGALTSEEAAQLGAELAEALHVVHTAGVVHRDIKPSNVLLSPAQLPGGRPRAKLADFGIAYLLDASRVTTPGLVIGTAAYLAPEQIRGGEPAAASDIYSLGLVLLESLTGERIHPAGAGMPAVLARLENPPVIPASLGPVWTDLLTRMTSLEPAERPTAAEVVAATAALAQHPGTAAGAAGVGVAAAGAVDAAAASADVPTLAVVAGTAATRTLTAATVVAPAAGAGAAATAPQGDARRRRLPVVIAAALGAVAVVVAAVLGIATLVNQQPEPKPVVTQPADPAPSDPAPAEVDTGGGEDAGTTDEDRKKADEARKKAEEAAKKAEEERKKAEEKAEEERKKAEDKRDDDD